MKRKKTWYVRKCLHASYHHFHNIIPGIEVVVFSLVVCFPHIYTTSVCPQGYVVPLVPGDVGSCRESTFDLINCFRTLVPF